MPNSSQDINFYKHQIVKAYKNDGTTFIDVIRDAPLLSGFTEAVNSATKAIQVVLPRRLDNYDGIGQTGSLETVTEGNVWKWYLFGPGLPLTGLLRYQGYVDDIEPKVDENGGESVVVTITPFSQILGDHAILGPVNYGTAGSSSTYVDSGTIFSSFFTTAIDPFTSKPYGDPFTLDPSNQTLTGIAVQYSFQNQKFIDALTQVLLMAPANSFFRPNPDNTMTFNVYPTSPTYTLALGQHITSMSYAIVNTPRRNFIIVAGKGVVAHAAGASISSSVGGLPAIGQRSLIKNDTRITDQNTAQQVANGLLAIYDRPQVRTKVKIPDYRGDAQVGIGFDIEKFKVGQTVRLLDATAPVTTRNSAGTLWDSMVWDRDKWDESTTSSIWDQMLWDQGTWGTTIGDVFHQVTPIVAINYYYNYCELELGYRQPSMNRTLYSIEQKLSDFTLIT